MVRGIVDVAPLKRAESVWLIQAPAVLFFLVAAPIPIESRYLVPILGRLILLTCSVLRLVADMAWAEGFEGARPFAAPALILLTAVYAKAAILVFARPRTIRFTRWRILS